MESKQILTELPKPFLRRMEKLLGAEYEAFFQGYEKERAQGLCFNQLKGNEQEFYKQNQERFGLKRVPWCQEGFYYRQDTRPGKNPLHEAGVYYIQEPSAMAAAALLSPLPGERVLDLCAAPGGKTTQIGAKLGKKGLLVSNEIHPGRARVLSTNVERMGMANTVVVNEEPRRLAEAFPEFFHRVLVDAPCSGEGMFRKEEQARIQWSEENVQLCAARQREILDDGARLLKDGGWMVYSTCTFSPEENERQMEEFLERHPEFSVVQVPEKERLPGLSPGRVEWTKKGCASVGNTFRVWHYQAEGEGHYVALLRKDKSSSQEEGESRGKRKGGFQGVWRDKEEKKALEDFLADIILQEDDEKILKAKGGQRLSFKELTRNLMRMGDQVYRMPDGTPNLDGIKVLRPGLHLGTLKKKRFEPSHALALALWPDQVKRKICLDLEGKAIREYLAGQSLKTEIKEKGWVLVCTEGYSLGWGKAVGDVVKNHYPRGLRQRGC